MLYQRFYPNSKIELFASLMFDHLDADQSGAIDFVEFYQVIIVTELSLDQQVVNMVFNGGKSDPIDITDYKWQFQPTRTTTPIWSRKKWPI